jgi:hypothetical protein
MATLLTTELLTKLRSLAEAEGLHADSVAGTSLTAEREIPMGKWFLGGRKAVYRMSCNLDEAAHDVKFREMTTESSWGVPPPSFKIETTSQSGMRTTQSTTVKSVAGGGSFDIGHVREAVEAAAVASGWQFHLEAGRRP